MFGTQNVQNNCVNKWDDAISRYLYVVCSVFVRLWWLFFYDTHSNLETYFDDFT